MDPLGENPWWTLLVAAVPALLCTILVFMDQQITAVIINRKEHKLKVRPDLEKNDSACKLHQSTNEEEKTYKSP